MKVVDYIADSANLAAKEAFRYAAAVPQDKRTWVPLEGGRSVIAIAQELAMTPTWGYSTLNGSPEDWSESTMAEQVSAMKTWTTLEECQTQFEERFKVLEAYVRQFPEERFLETKWLPFDGGRDFTMLEILDYTRWNCTYHEGQIAYIQTLYGDKEMH